MKKLNVPLSDNNHDLTDNGIQNTPKEKVLSVDLYLAVEPEGKSVKRGTELSRLQRYKNITRSLIIHVRSRLR